MTTPWAMLSTWASPVGAGFVVEEKNGDLFPGEILLERQDLPTVAQRRFRKQAQLRQGIENDARRMDALHLGQQSFRRAGQFDLRGMEKRAAGLGPQFFLRCRQLEKLHLRQVPTVRGRDGFDLVARLGKGHV